MLCQWYYDGKIQIILVPLYVNDSMMVRSQLYSTTLCQWSNQGKFEIIPRYDSDLIIIRFKLCHAKSVIL